MLPLQKERQVKIATENIIFWLILDPITFGLGSIGGYILFREFVEHERLPHRDEWLPLLKQHWFAILALGISIGYFVFRLLYILNS
jgi:preprotein translocase subunit Sss1